jgi:hypothetical protein
MLVAPAERLDWRGFGGFVQGLDRLVRADAPPPPAISLVDSEVRSDAAALRQISNEAVLTSRVRIASWSFLIVAGAIEAIFGRHGMNPDGVSYLDMGDAMMRGDWKMAVNGHWSPLYPWLQGLALKLFKPSSYEQFSVVHFVNFLIFLFALASFDFLLRMSIASRSGSNGFRRGVTDIGGGRLPGWTVFAVGYAVFFWASIGLIVLGRVSPDLLMAGFVYLAVGLLLKIRAQPANFSGYLFLGAALGFGYLAKAPFFPLSIALLAIAWIFAGGWRRAAPRVLAGVAVFLAISAPWITALSESKGRLTFGDSGRLNQLLWVDDAAPKFLALGTAGGRYTHPIRQIFQSPPVYEFAGPVKGTLPVWYDPSYWSDGALPRIELRKQMSVFVGWLGFYFDLLFTSQTALVIGFAVLCLMSGRNLVLKQVTARWPVWLIGLVGLGMYALVHVEPRYVAAFFTLFWVGLFSGLKMPPGLEGRRLTGLVALGVVLAMASPTALLVARHLRRTLEGQVYEEWQVAENLRGMGVNPGDRVARIGGGFGMVYWARLLSVTEVAEVPDEYSMTFWDATPAVQEQVIETFQRLGVTAIIADMTNDVHTPGPEWHKIGDGYFAIKVPPGGNGK